MKKLTLKFKLLGAFGTLALIATLIGIAGLLTSDFFYQGFEKVLHTYLPVAKDNQAFENQILQIMMKEKEYLQKGKRGAEREEVHQLRHLISRSRIESLKANIDPYLSGVYSQIEKSLNQYDDVYHQAVNLQSQKWNLEINLQEQSRRILRNITEYLTWQKKSMGNGDAKIENLVQGEELLGLAKECFFQREIFFAARDKISLEKWGKSASNLPEEYQKLYDQSKEQADIHILSQGITTAEGYAAIVKRVIKNEAHLLNLLDDLEKISHKILLDAQAGKQAAWDQLDQSHKRIDRMASRVKSIFFLAIFLAIGLAWFLGIALSGHITRPIIRLVEVFTNIAKGDLSHRIQVSTGDEIQTLAETANAMADQLQKRIKGQQEILEITRTMGSFIEIDELMDNLLDNLLKIFNFQIGAFYLFDPTENLLRLKSSKGATQPLFTQSNVKLGEGLIGMAGIKKEIQILHNIPHDTVFTLKSILGENIPNQMINIPFFFHDKLIGVLSLAGFYPLSEDHLNTVDIIAKEMGIAMANAQSYTLVQKQAEDLRQQGEELAMQNEELQTQTEELEAQSDELSTQQRELETINCEIQESDRLKTEFLTNMSHELRTPLNSIISFSQLLLDKIPGEINQEQEKQITIIARNGKNLLHLINDILDLSKVEAGLIDLHNLCFQVEDLTKEVQEGIEPLVHEKGLKFSLILEKNLPAIITDRHRLNQILLNLLNNALKFTPEGEIGLKVGTIDLQHEFIYFKVWDTGIGIDSKDQEFIFEEFRQVDGSSTRSYGGTGLGLTIVNKLVRLLGGEIMVESEPGKGSAFTVTIPVERKNMTKDWAGQGFSAKDKEIIGDALINEPSHKLADAQKKRKQYDPYQSPGSMINILIIDKDPVSAQSLISVLKSREYLMDIAKDEATAAEFLNNKKPDLIILDPEISPNNNFPMLENLKANPSTRNIPIIILTSKDFNQEELELLEQKSQKIIRKGIIRKETLLKEVWAALDAFYQGYPQMKI